MSWLANLFHIWMNLIVVTCIATVEYKQNKKHNTHKHKQTCTYTVHTCTHTHTHTHAHGNTHMHTVLGISTHTISFSTASIQHWTSHTISFSTARIQHWTSHWTSHTISFSTARMIQHKPEQAPPKIQYCECVRRGQPASYGGMRIKNVVYLTVSTKVWQLNSQCVSNDCMGARRTRNHHLRQFSIHIIETRGVSQLLCAFL